MKRPLRVKIIGKTHQINYVPADNAALVDAQGDSLLGCIDHDGQSIAVAEGQSFETTQDVLLHEILHGVERAMDLEVDESVIERLSTGLLAVLKDNPGVARFIIARH